MTINKIHLYSIVSLTGALIAGTPALSAQSEGSAKTESSQVQRTSQTSQSQKDSKEQIREKLRSAGLESSEIEKLSKDGFKEQEVREAVAKALKEDGRSSEEAERRAKEIARQVASARSGQSSRDQVSREAREMAPEGAEVEDSARMVLNEEELNVETRQVAEGGILLRKRIVSDDASENVQLRREEIEIVRLSPEEAEERRSENLESGFGESFQEGEIFIPLMREEANAEKEVTTREVVQAQTQTETEEKEFDATLRREEVEVEKVGELEEGQVARRDEPSGDEAEQSARGLERQIRERLKSDEVGLSDEQLSNIEIEVEDETVHLSGEVSSEQLKQRIEETVRSLPQVRSVENELQIS